MASKASVTSKVHIIPLSLTTYRQIISNISVHAHSQAQVRKWFDPSGRFQLLGRKTVEKYEKDFGQYKQFINTITALLIGIPKYLHLFGIDK